MHLIEERHNKFKAISQKSLADKLSEKREKYIISHEKYLVNKKQEEKRLKLEQNTFLKSIYI